jgi:hypothetical protein
MSEQLPEPVDIERPFDVSDWGDKIVVYEDESEEERAELYPELALSEGESGSNRPAARASEMRAASPSPSESAWRHPRERPE